MGGNTGNSRHFLPFNPPFSQSLQVSIEILSVLNSFTANGIAPQCGMRQNGIRQNAPL